MSLTSCCCNCKGKIIASSLPEKYDFKHGVSEADFLSTPLNRFSGIRPFRTWIQMVLPQVYDDALSYQELVYKLLAYINTLIEDMSKVEENVTALEEAFKQLQCYVNCYFKKLDLTGEVEKKLDAMSLDGTLGTLMSEFFALGSGIQSKDTTESQTTTSTVVEKVENYPQCCCCCDCCDSCPYYKLADGDSVVSTFTGGDITVKTTISRNGDEITTVKETTSYITKRIIYSDLAEGTGISIDPDSSTKEGTQTISMNIDSDGNSGVEVIENDDGSVSFKLKLTDGDGIKTEELSDGSVKISSLIKQGAGILVSVDDDGYYVITSLAASSIDNALTVGSDYSYDYKNNFYCVDDSGVSYQNYDYLGGVTDWTKLSHYCDPDLNGVINKDGDDNVTGITVTIEPPTSWVHAGNMADTSLFKFKHTTPYADCPECALIDIVFKGDYAALSKRGNKVTLSAPEPHVWNIARVNGSTDNPITSSSDSDDLAGFGASWNVGMSIGTYYDDDDVRHFVIMANTIADGYNTQYSRYGDYMYGYWLNTGSFSITYSA